MVLVQYLEYTDTGFWRFTCGQGDTCVTLGTEIYNGNLSRLLEADVMLIQHPAIINTFSKM